MKNLISLFALFFFFLSACSVPPEEPNQQALVETAMAEIEARALLTQAAQQSLPTATNAPEVAPDTPTPLTVVGSDIFALNYLETQDRAGVVIEIARVLVGSKQAAGEYIGGNFNELSEFQDKNTVVEIIFKVTNNTGQVISVYPDQGTVIIGSEQIDLTNYFFYGVGEDVSGDIFPGVTLIGGLYFAVGRSTVDEISEMTVAITGPYNQNFDKLGEDYLFTLDLSNHIFEEIPEELR